MRDNQLAQNIKALRKRKGYSQEALAEISGLSIRTVQRIENENRNPSGDSLKRLSSALGVSPDYLLEWEPNENSNFLLILAFSPILCVINPFLAILVPLILWSIQKNKIRGVKRLGEKILKTQIIWLVIFFIFRTINFLRLKYIVKNTNQFVGDQWDSFLADIETQSYLKTFFIAINILIILFMTYKTYQNNQKNQPKRTVKNPNMKSYLFIIVILFFTACNNKNQTNSQRYIEPCEYSIMGYQVKNVAYHDSVKSFLTDDSYISVSGDSTFTITNKLGEFLFDGNSFGYKIINDSLILSNDKQRSSYKILELNPNSFKLEVGNKYFNRIDFIKPIEKRRRIETVVEIEY
ncbi:helix-turn-helix domain-containing protein [Draconibacterium sediminis]|uniref:helix-turn-helix domain-containing protein n=1 Tax=Draconibacterium sediminis TaxID=1544798 RepID=UPI000695CB75|nr:helix-turn-helix domain-containing protein [Draconibacterium sediminis]